MNEEDIDWVMDGIMYLYGERVHLRFKDANSKKIVTIKMFKSFAPQILIEGDTIYDPWKEDRGDCVFLCRTTVFNKEVNSLVKKGIFVKEGKYE